MQLIREEFKEEIKSAQIFLNSINDIKNREIQCMMYSSTVLILYNIIESTISKILIRVHDEIISQHDNGFTYHQFNDNIKTVIYKCNHTNQSVNKFNFNSLANLKMLEFTPGTEYGKRQLNGNVDGKKIQEIFKEYGIFELQNLKQARQNLAHGNQTFKEYGQRTSTEDIRKFLFSTKGTLFNAINNVDSYIREQQFFQKKQAPA